MLANIFAPRDGILRVHMLAHGDTPLKSDAFLLAYNGAYLLIDGGASDTDAALAYLLDLRRTLLCDHPEYLDDPACRLRVDLAATHCHGDHVGAWHRHILPSPLLEIGTVRMPPDSALDAYYHTVGIDGDTRFRPHIAAALAKHQPQARVLTHGFGIVEMHTFHLDAADAASPTVTVCPADGDWGLGERLESIIDTYHEGNRDRSGIPTQAVNNCSDWFYVRHGAHSFLFMGDNVKKRDDRTDESGDIMAALYRPILGSADVVKYMHHGYRRDPAAAAVMSFDPQYVVVTTVEATGQHAIRALYPDSPVRLLNCGEQTYIFATDGAQLTVSTAAP